MALYSAAEEVIATQSAKLAIQCRFVADMKLIWMLQLRFERRTGKNPYTLVEHPKYRAGYDFMLLRSALGHVPESLVHWWEDFVDADEQKRADMVAQAEVEARRTATQARAGSKSRQKSSATKSASRKRPHATSLAISPPDVADLRRKRPESRSRQVKQSLQKRLTMPLLLFRLSPNAAVAVLKATRQNPSLNCHDRSRNRVGCQSGRAQKGA